MTAIAGDTPQTWTDGPMVEERGSWARQVERGIINSLPLTDKKRRAEEIYLAECDTARDAIVGGEVVV